MINCLLSDKSEIFKIGIIRLELENLCGGANDLRKAQANRFICV